jgi:hypothetical protein
VKPSVLIRMFSARANLETTRLSIDTMMLTWQTSQLNYAQCGSRIFCLHVVPYVTHTMFLAQYIMENGDKGVS